METTNDYGMADMLASQEAANKASREKMKKQQQQSVVAKKPVVGGTTTVRAESLTAVGQERRMQKEGMAGVGRNPENVVIGKREDWDQSK